MGSQEILSKHGSTEKIGNNQEFNTSINGNLTEDESSMPILRKVIRQELSHNSSTDIYLRCRVDLTSNAVGTEAPYFMHVDMPAVNESDETRSFGTPDTRTRRLVDGCN